MSSGTLKCAECGVEMTSADADDAVRTDAGPVHRECFEGPVMPPDLPDDLLVEEEAARRDHNDVPVAVGLLDHYDPEEARTQRELERGRYSFGEERPC